MKRKKKQVQKAQKSPKTRGPARRKSQPSKKSVRASQDPAFEFPPDFEPAPLPQASAMNPVPESESFTEWRDASHGALQYRLFGSGNFEIQGKIRDPEELPADLARVGELLQEKVRTRRLRSRSRKTRSRAVTIKAAREPELFPRKQTATRPGRKLKDIKAL